MKKSYLAVFQHSICETLICKKIVKLSFGILLIEPPKAQQHLNILLEILERFKPNSVYILLNNVFM